MILKFLYRLSPQLFDSCHDYLYGAVDLFGGVIAAGSETECALGPLLRHLHGRQYM